jgi:YidC/Oxa1 family membrane protein insertase
MDKRTILAVALSLAVLMGWSIFFQKKQVPQYKKPAQGTAPAPAASPSDQKTPPAKKEAALPATPLEKPMPSTLLSGISGEDVVVETDLYRAVFTTGGAVLKHWELKKYKDKSGKPVILLKEPGNIPPLSLLLEGPDRMLPQKLTFSVNTKKITLTSGGKESGELIFSFNNSGILIRKKLVFYNNSYKVDLSIETENTPSFLLPVGTSMGIFDKNGSSRAHSGPLVLLNMDKENFTEKSGDKFMTGNINWIAQEDLYFTAAMVPQTTIEGAKFWKEAGESEIALSLKPGKHSFLFYAGPKEYDRLKQLNVKLEHIIDFGWFSIIAMPLFWVLKFFYKYIGNYGWSIVILTILVRVPFIPILNKSQQSMKKMQKIQPLMAELKEKYKNDPQKMQKETMALYKKYKVNPVGGCLPMLLQIPVFIALYNVLLQAIELRGAPFVFWITDLASKDPYYILPVVMGLTMVIQQKMTPSAMDPKQAKMMMLMPVVFTFMFLTFPAGLVIYWLVNNVLGIIQQYFVNKKATA